MPEAGPLPPRFLVAGRRVDATANTVERDGETVRVEPRVMRLLVCLAEHRGRVVTRDDLLAKVWAHTVVGYDALTQSVSKLRKALGDTPNPSRLIETVAKRGYRLTASVTPVWSGAGDVETAKRAETPPPDAVVSPPRPSPMSRWKLPLAAFLILLTTLPVWVALQPDRPNVQRSADTPSDPGNELSYETLIDSPKRLKCIYGTIAQVTGDYGAAIRIFEDCVQRWNDVYSMIGLAQLYENGAGVPRDLTRATLLMKRGAEKPGNDDYSSLARYHYGVALVEGNGIAPDTVKGLRWLQRAAAEGVDDAEAYIAQHFPAVRSSLGRE